MEKKKEINTFMVGNENIIHGNSKVRRNDLYLLYGGQIRKMNKKGMEMSGVGSLVVLAVAIIVVMSILPTIASNTAVLNTQNVVVNSSVTAPTVGNTITLVGQAYSNIIVTNASTGDVVPASNYTIKNYVVGADGTLGTTLTAKFNDTIGWTGRKVNISATVEPYGYDTSAGGRSMASLIIILTSLAIAVVVVMYVVKNDVLDF